MKKIILIMLVAMLIIFACSCAPDKEDDEVENPNPNPNPIYFTNPVLKADRPDPHIIKHDGWIYMFSTGGRISKSQDLISWSDCGNAFSVKPSWGTANAGIWAPDIVKIGEKFIIYYSLSVWGDANPGIGYAVADHPEGPWEDKGKLFLSLEIGVNNSIDPTVFVAQDGKVYMIWGSFRGLYGVELNPDGIGLKDGTPQAAAENKVHIAGLDTSLPWNGNTYEGTYVIFKDGYYYMFVSVGTCCAGLNSTYHIKVARSVNPLGPYNDDLGNSMLGTDRGHLVVQANSSIIGPGHNSIYIDDAGQYWLVYHCWYNDNGSGKGRWVAIDKLQWNNKGWPSVKGQMPSVKKTEGPVINNGTS